MIRIAENHPDLFLRLGQGGFSAVARWIILCMGSVHYCAEDEVFHGKLEGIEDLVSFEAKSVDALKWRTWE